MLEALLSIPLLEATINHVGTDTSAIYLAVERLRASMPAAERDRQRRVARLERSSAGSSHPPTASRIAVVEALGAPTATVTVDAHRWAAIRAELEPFTAASARRIVDARRARLSRY
jgi:hypothetical protein